MTPDNTPAFDRFFHYQELTSILEGGGQNHPTLMQQAGVIRRALALG